jgi:hypothetical protein
MIVTAYHFQASLTSKCIYFSATVRISVKAPRTPAFDTPRGRQRRSGSPWNISGRCETQETESPTSFLEYIRLLTLGSHLTTGPHRLFGVEAGEELLYWVLESKLYESWLPTPSPHAVLVIAPSIRYLPPLLQILPDSSPVCVFRPQDVRRRL